MKDCRTCIYWKPMDGRCDNYLCRNQSEYDEYIRRKEHGSDGGNAAAGRPGRRVPVL